MPTINFPAGPSTNDTYNLGLRTWKWNGEAWALQPLTGGFTGSQGAIGYTGSTGVFNTDTNVPSLSIDNINIDNNSITALNSSLEQVSYTSVTTNLFTPSQTFNTGDWSTYNVTVAVNNTTAPDGTTTADKITQNSGSTNVDLANFRDVGLTSNSGTVYTISIHAKISANRNFLVINEHISSDFFRKTWFNLSNGTVGTNYSGHTATITDVGNGWYRCSITVTSTVTNTDSIIMFGPAETDGTHIITDNQGSMFFWGAQLEESATLTGYLPTTSVSLSGITGVTRGVSGTTAATASSGDVVTLGSTSTTLATAITATQDYIPLASLTGVAASGTASIGTSNMDLNLSSSGTGSVKIPGALTVGVGAGSTANFYAANKGGIGVQPGNAGLTIQNDSVSDDTLLIQSTEDSDSAAPIITLKRNSSSPADADYIGQIKFKGENDNDQEVIYAKITAKIGDASDGAEDGIIEFANKNSGSNTITARLTHDTLKLINGTGLEVDGNVGIGTSVPGAKLHILQTAETYDDGLKVVGSTSPISGRIYMNDTDVHIDNATAGAASGLILDSSGNIGLGTSSPAEKLDVTGNVKITGALTLSSGVSNSTSIVIKNSSGTALKTMYGTTS